MLFLFCPDGEYGFGEPNCFKVYRQKAEYDVVISVTKKKGAGHECRECKVMAKSEVAEKFFCNMCLITEIINHDTQQYASVTGASLKAQDVGCLSFGGESPLNTISDGIWYVLLRGIFIPASSYAREEADIVVLGTGNDFDQMECFGNRIR